MVQYLYIWVEAYWFSATSLTKWLPGGHVGFFGFQTNISLALNINSKLQWHSTYVYTSVAQYLCIWVRAYWFSVTSFSKWLPGGHISFFGFWTAWFRQRKSSLLWNFIFKFYVHVLCGCRQKPSDCQLCHFQNGCLVILKMFNCNPPIAHCHPLLWGGGILVDHSSTISSYFSEPSTLHISMKLVNRAHYLVGLVQERCNSSGVTSFLH